MDGTTILSWGIEQTGGCGIFMWHGQNYFLLPGLLILPVVATVALLFVGLACVIEGSMARKFFPDKRKMWIVVIATVITNIIANLFMQADYFSGPSVFTSAEEAAAFAASRTIFDSVDGAFAKLILITIIVETIVILAEWLIYKLTHCCKHTFLFSLDANITSFSIGTLIQLLILMPNVAFANPIVYYRFSMSEIATQEDWTFFFNGRPMLYFCCVAVCAAMLVCGILLMLWLQKAETQKEKLNA